MKALGYFAVLLLLVLGSEAGAAESPRALTWEELVPAMPPIEDPFTHLTPDQRLDLHAIAGIRSQAALGQISRVSDTYEISVELTDKLKRQGLDVEGLLATLKDVQRKIDEQDQMVVAGLEGQVVRMPGYALPLEFSGTGVKEFLLVPYVGACIHVPPPPPNQMVFVRLDKAFQMDDIYTPVMITGRMSVKRTVKALSLVDGQANVNAGYVLEGMKVEPYTE